MKVYRPILIALTILVSLLMSIALISSWTEPQVQGQLNLYQSDLVLQASEWKELDQAMGEDATLRKSFFGDNPVKDATETYQSVRKSVQSTLGLTPGTEPSSTQPAASKAKSLQPQSRKLLDQVNLNLGILYAQAGEPNKAIATWSSLIQDPAAFTSLQQTIPAAQVLSGLWSNPPQILPNAEETLTQTLKGWFRFQSLAKLYDLQQRMDAALTLQDAQQSTAASAFIKLVIVGTIPVLGCIAGVLILLVWGVRVVFRLQGRAKALATLQTNGTEPSRAAIADKLESASPEISLAEKVVWSEETIWQVMVLWFTAFLGVSYVVAPLVVAVLGLKPSQFDGRAQAYFALFSYGSLMGVGFSILHLSLSPYLKSVFRWLQVRWSGGWLLWGLGGYFVALPLVLLVSLFNQQLLKEQGGSNPILDIILQDHDLTTIVLLWFLVAVCAPVFEETLFRGFFLTSLTRYLPVWQAIAFSGVVFAIAHLNLGDLLPLSILGMVLGVVYLRSRNLLASILLHSLWNSGSFISLLVLGSSGT